VTSGRRSQQRQSPAKRSEGGGGTAYLPPPPIEHTFPSPPTAWDWVKIERPPGPKGSVSEANSFRLKLAKRAMRRPLPATIRFRGGPQCWVEIQARGRVFRFTGDTALYDALRWMTKN
jgi:hypothetical protein